MIAIVTAAGSTRSRLHACLRVNLSVIGSDCQCVRVIERKGVIAKGLSLCVVIVVRL